MNNRQKGLMLVATTALISGISIFINGFSVKMIDPSVFSFLKNSIVGIGLIGVVLASREIDNIRALKAHQWAYLALIGLVGGCIPFLLFFNGMALAGSSAGSLIHKSMFLFVAIGSAIFLKERLNAKILLAATILICGNALIIKGSLANPGLGQALVLAATLFWAVENLMSKHLLKSTTGNIVAAGRMVFGSSFMAVYLGLTGQLGSITAMTSEQWLWTVIPTLFLFGYVLTWYNGLKHISVSLATVILLIGSPVTTLLNFAILHKPMDIAQWTGAALLIIGSIAWLIGQQPKTPQQKTSAA
jgi:drug/metabolite transporter (DMT)-like permease